MLKAAKAYLATQVTTASQGDLLVMLYDTAIKHLRQSIEKMRVGDMAGKGILISKAITIVSELQQCLNKERGGEIAKNLSNLYFFCNTRLLMANLKVKPEIVEEVITILSGLRQAFAQILPNQEGVASLTQPGAHALNAAPQEPMARPETVTSETQALEIVTPETMTPEAQAPEIEIAAAHDVAAALYVPVAPPVQTAQEAAATPKTSVAPPAAPQMPAAPVPAGEPVAVAPGLRLRAANAYATTR
ncbi:MAG: flagellar export chaperone FliS [Humidesulfovibrio sp.]|nr:flagellar export chaperone FliS [Humidesulfovibrio sp.]